MIIDSSYFKGDIYLPQVGDGASRQVNNDDALKNFIYEYEPRILIKGLGRRLYKEFSAELQNNGTIKTTADQKWSDLLNGKEYTKDSTTYYWRGIVEKQGSLVKSFIAYYVYYWYVRDGVAQKTTLGVVDAKAKNAKGASAIPTLTHAWREFHSWYIGSQDTFNGRFGYHKGVFVEDYFNGVDNTKEVSLFQFLSDHTDDYSNWSFTDVENENNWGI